ncbi:calcyphosin [Brachionus plicatilis]|uniref:Calcyphosin n=1 Tax=Brachionus plicatilis TaxID=10195 RepID=A0A3M7RIW9_BRAPC|nr:calcyphosin [Brachionus plicatilis]
MLTIFNLKKLMQKRRLSHNALKLPVVNDTPFIHQIYDNPNWNLNVWPMNYDESKAMFKIKKTDSIDQVDLLTNLTNFFLLKKEFQDFGCRIDFESCQHIPRSVTFPLVNSSSNCSRCYYSSIQLYVAQIFRSMDTDFDNRLSFGEFRRGIRNLIDNIFYYEETADSQEDFTLYRRKNTNKVQIDDKLLFKLFKDFDLNHDGFIDYCEFVKGFQLPMCPKRLSLLNAAFEKLDCKTRDNIIDVEDVKFWLINSSNNKKLNERRMNQSAMIWMSQFCRNKDKNSLIDRDKFIEFYQILSSTIISDAYFDLIIRSSYNI